MSIKNLKINSKKIKTILKTKKKMVLGTLSTVLILNIGGFLLLKDDKQEPTLPEMVDTVKDITCFDEMLEINHFNIEKIDELSKYVELSEKINNLDIRRFENMDKLNHNLYSDKNYSIPTPEYIESLINTYEKDKKDKKYKNVISNAEQSLIFLEPLLNQFLYEKGYNTAGEGLIILAKSIILDNISSQEKDFSKVEICSKAINGARYLIENDGLVYEVESKSDLGELINTIYYVQECAKPTHGDPKKYNSKRNQCLTKAITDIKSLLNNQAYKIDEQNKLCEDSNGIKRVKRK